MVIFSNFFIKNGTFRKFLKSRFDPNMHQKRIKLHHFKKKIGGSMLPNPPSKACKFPNLKNNYLFWPPSQILATPLCTV